MATRGGEQIICFFDGACPGNQFGGKGPMRAAYTIGDMQFVRDVPDLRTSEGPMRSNNIAEYHGLIYLLQHLKNLSNQRRERGRYSIRGDSQLVIRQMRGQYKVRSPHLRRLHEEASRLLTNLEVELREVPREKNRAGVILEMRTRRLEATREN
jgi:ribonuclease HI